VYFTCKGKNKEKTLRQIQLTVSGILCIIFKNTYFAEGKMASQIDQLRNQFNALPTPQKAKFIGNLKIQLQNNKKPEYTKFYNECVNKYNAEVRGGAKSTPAKNKVSSQSNGNYPLGNLIIKGHGKDADDEKTIYTIIVISMIAVIILAYFAIGSLSENHFTGPRATMYGIRIGDSIMPANVARALSAMFIAFCFLGSIGKLRPDFNSKIFVFEEGISGISKEKEIFELRYSEISSVHYSQEKESWKNVNINASGKIYQVYTSKCKEIATEINMRRKV
jgi:hypothetical protein